MQALNILLNIRDCIMTCNELQTFLDLIMMLGNDMSKLSNSLIKWNIVSLCIPTKKDKCYEIIKSVSRYIKRKVFT